MSEINYKAEVLKVLPRAVCIKSAKKVPHYMIISAADGGGGTPIGNWYKTPEDAWDRAHNRLKQQGNI